MITLLLPTLWAAEPCVEPCTKTHFVALPNVGYDTDDGLGFGGRLELTRVREGVDPYLLSLVVQGFATLNGYHHHRIRLDLPHLPGEHRLTAFLAFRMWLNDGYWGMGNGAIREEERESDFYHYSLLQPYSRITLSRRIAGPWSAFVALEGKWSRVTTETVSLLAEEKPYGMDGGLSVQVVSGVRWDTRQPEVTPEKGGMVELALRGAPPLGPAGQGAFLGIFGSVRGFWQVFPRLNLGARTMAEYLYGEVPFYEMVHWAGWMPVAGMGGADTLRGVSFGRFHGPGKWVLNTEARIDVVEHLLFRRSMRWQLVPFADVGAVFGVAEAERSADAPAVPLHPGVGGGIRAIFDTTLVGRVDLACGWDPATRDGALARRPDLGVYVVFDHTF